MIEVINHGKIERQPFFQKLINYLWTHDDVTLRQIKKAFEDEVKIDRAIEDYVQAGYVVRKDKRYTLNLPLLTSLDGLELDSLVFIDTESPIYNRLLTLTFETTLGNQTNGLLIEESTDFARHKLTLSNYFYKLRHSQKLSEEQTELYDLLGDVNQEYALKYMTTFLLKFGSKDVVKQKRPDIFVEALVIMGYIRPVDETSYTLDMTFNPDELRFKA
ncbi:DUF1803 domain-containing protein [uncultured Streptococcus sp.]|uniref:DUF1803 domain-containing protein n=1 Tax=uncultured Streptococcus sp. TaxID=83427 RepID=UPI0027DB3E8A|nr:DUF1803 domain-containing protein [uncultured Streptococcus sp.]